MITSIHNPKIQRIRALLANRHERHQQQVFVLEGIRLVEEAVRSNWTIEHLIFSSSISLRGKNIIEECEKKGILTDEVPENIIASISDTETSQGILAVTVMVSLLIPTALDFVLIADNIRDPGNLGTLLRTAAAAAVDLVVLTPGTADAYNPKVVRAAMGAHFRIPIQTADWPEVAARFKPDLKFLLAEMENSSPLWQVDFHNPLAIIIGGEAEGASENARQLADLFVSIPMPGKMESLNAAIASGIILFEVVRQRNQ